MANYHAGRRAEWRARDILKARGYHTVIRSAGSKGPIDLFGIAAHGIALVQVKHGRGISSRERAELQELKAQLPPLCRLEVWRFTKGYSEPSVEAL